MALKFMYITNDPTVARIAESTGVDRIFIDMEYIGKSDRQGGMDTVRNHHTVEDIVRIKNSISKAKLMVRVNPVHEASAAYTSSKEEIDAAIEAGADILMLPYFKTADEVSTFLRLVNGRAKTLLLIETPEAVANIDGILSLEGIDEVFVGLNDLSLGYGKAFMFELLTDGTVENLCIKFRLKGLPYGFGGIAAPGHGMLPAECVIAEHYRLGSTCAILSRSFCNTGVIRDAEEIRTVFEEGLRDIRRVEAECEAHMARFWENRERVCRVVREIAEKKALT